MLFRSGRFAESDTKPDATEAGPAFVRAFTAAHPDLPHLVIGGVGPENIDEVIAAGGRGGAVCASVCAAADPSEVVAGLRLALQQAVAGDLEAAGDAG